GRAEAVLPIRGEKGHVGDSSFAGRVVREGDAWLWLRTGAGVMRTLAGQYPVSESTIAALPPRPIPAPAAVPVPPADDDAATAEPILSADPATPAPEHEADPAADLE